ncbi:hypothetical protein T492DRAFT_875547 [Pavlovales sp. CCMP2436]|nr:hypothetical protein T492DRAFT_875547 [Pavlovales sp. CCMP2436]
MADWTLADLDQYGSYATAHFAHSQLYYVRDVSRAWCELFCARGRAEGEGETSRRWFRLARHSAERAERAALRLRAWRCGGPPHSAHVLQPQSLGGDGEPPSLSGQPRSFGGDPLSLLCVHEAPGVSV